MKKILTSKLQLALRNLGSVSVILKCTFLCTLLLGFSSFCSALNMLEDGSMWVYWEYYTYYDDITTFENVTVGVNTVYYINGESEIEGKKYKDIWCCKKYFNEKANRLEYNRYYCASFREEEGRVYSRVDVYRSTFYMIYDFYLPIYTENIDRQGNEYILYDFNKEQGTINVINKNGEVLSTYQSVIPNVGDRHFLLNPTRYESTVSIKAKKPTELLQYYRGGELAWENTELDKEKYVVYADMQTEIDHYMANYRKANEVDHNLCFLHEGNVWTYTNLCSIKESNDVVTAWHYKYYVNGGCEINGKHYVNIWVATLGYVTDKHPLYGEHASAPYFDDIEDSPNKMSFCDTANIYYHYVTSLREEDSKIHVILNNYAKSCNIERIDWNAGSQLDWIWDLPHDDEYVLYNFATENDSIIPNIGNKYSLLYFISYVDENHLIPVHYGQTRRLWTGTKVTQHEQLNLFYRDGKLEYKSPNFYPDPFFPDELADGIKEITNLPKNEGGIYNLQGQRISHAQKGLNIIDGRKVWVR